VVSQVVGTMGVWSEGILCGVLGVLLQS